MPAYRGRERNDACRNTGTKNTCQIIALCQDNFMVHGEFISRCSVCSKITIPKNWVKANRRNLMQQPNIAAVVGVRGFEPPLSCSRRRQRAAAINMSKLFVYEPFNTDRSRRAAGAAPCFAATVWLVGVRGFEPPLSCSRSRRFTGLSYTPFRDAL